MALSNELADRIHQQLKALLKRAKPTPEQERAALKARDEMLEAVFRSITPESLEAAARMRRETVDEPCAVVHYRIAPKTYATVILTQDELSRIQNRFHDEDQRFDELTKLLGALDESDLERSLFTYLVRRRSELSSQYLGGLRRQMGGNP